ncbi:hypothetical protein PTKIN_Ptkin06aG0061100 [Pterospermum kingtungense]
MGSMKDFCEKVKENASPVQYFSFLGYINQYSYGKITMEDFKDSVKGLIGEHKGFFGEFLYDFRFSNGLTSLDISNKRKKSGSNQGDGEESGCNYNNKKIRLDKIKSHLSQAMEFCEKVRNKANSEDYLKFLKCLHDYGTGKITMDGVKIMVADYFPDFMVEFDNVLEFYGSISAQPSSESQRETGNKVQKPQKNRNTTQLDELTPSYKYLPDNVSGFHSSGVTELGKQVLNSCCFSEGSFEDGRTKRVDRYQKKLNDREDKLFERDMLMAWMDSTKKNASSLLKAIEEGEIQKPTVEDVNKYFTSYNFRFIEKMYGASGSLMVDELRHSPQVVLPVLINRLNQKQRECLLE